MNELIDDSLEYPLRSDDFLRLMTIGGALSFVELVALNTFLDAFLTVAAPVVASDSTLEEAVLAFQGELTTSGDQWVLAGLMALGVASFVVISGFRVRIVERVMSGEESPPGFADGAHLLFGGALFCATSLALFVIVLTGQLLFMLIYSALVVGILGVPSGNVVALLGAFGISVVFAFLLVYPVPSVYVLVARFQQRTEAGGSYVRFVVSRRRISEFRTILLSREYVASWGALIVVFILYGAATSPLQGSIVGAQRPMNLIVGLSRMGASAVLGFYADVAVMFIYGSLFDDRTQQTSVLDF